MTISVGDVYLGELPGSDPAEVYHGMPLSEYASLIERTIRVRYDRRDRERREMANNHEFVLDMCRKAIAMGPRLDGRQLLAVIEEAVEDYVVGGAEARFLALYRGPHASAEDLT